MLDEAIVREIVVSRVKPVGLSFEKCQKSLSMYFIREGTKYYLKQLKSESKTRTRDMILNIMRGAPDNRVKTTELKKEI